METLTSAQVDTSRSAPSMRYASLLNASPRFIHPIPATMASASTTNSPNAVKNQRIETPYSCPAMIGSSADCV